MGLRVIPVDVYKFEVDEDDETYVVNLQTMKCNCYKWNLLEIPCTQAMACISRRKLDFVPYVNEAYYVSTHVKTYSPIFHGMPGHKQWSSSTVARPLPTPFRNMPGRPSKKKRKPEANEGRDGKKKKGNLVSRKKKDKCANCDNFGQYKKTCKNPPKPTTSAPKVKVGRPSKNASISSQSRLSLISSQQSSISNQVCD